ncbi:MAG: CopG family transcriptional regulator [Proteobacteria bacterium]|nr:CopG family transcriptional regulator [Pseudomonadota bacterium]
MKAKDLDEIFDNGEDITSYLDLSTKIRPGLKQRRVNVDFPDWMINSLDKEARKIGVTRQSIIKIWISERIKAETSHHS